MEDATSAPCKGKDSSREPGKISWQEAFELGRSLPEGTALWIYFKSTGCDMEGGVKDG